MRPLLTARGALRTAQTPFLRAPIPSARVPIPATCVFQQHARAHARGLASTAPLRARYERFETPSYGQPGGGGRNNVHNFLRRRLGGDRGVMIFGVAIGGGVIYYIAHLERVPGTGRLRFMDCSPEMEAEMGKESFGETMNEFGRRILPANHPVSIRVRNIAQRIVERNGLGKMKAGHTLGSIEGEVGSWGFGGADPNEPPTADTEWEVYVVDDPQTKNAFVLPGGKIFVFTGILPVSANDDGLATVMGHEVAHVVARHGAERMSQMKVLFAVSFLLESLGLDVGLTRLLVTFLLQLPNSRTNETEADQIGLKLMAQACFNPAESTHMWERMSEGGASNMDFMSTHPANAKRIKALGQQVPEAQEIRSEKCGNTAQMAAQMGDGFGTQFGNAFKRRSF